MITIPSSASRVGPDPLDSAVADLSVRVDNNEAALAKLSPVLVACKSYSSYKTEANDRLNRIDGSGIYSTDRDGKPNVGAIDGGWENVVESYDIEYCVNGYLVGVTSYLQIKISPVLDGTFKKDGTRYADLATAIAAEDDDMSGVLHHCKDTLGIEVWWEEVSLFDIVFMHGDVSYDDYLVDEEVGLDVGLLKTLSELGVPDSYGYTNPGLSGDSGAKAFKWSTLTTEQQLSFIAISKNRMAVDNGKLLQLRSRYASFRHGGSQMSPGNTYTATGSTFSPWARGSLVDPKNTGPYDNTRRYTILNNTPPLDRALLSESKTLVTTNNRDPSYGLSYDGEVYCLMIADWQRHNKGIYEPGLNEYGSAAMTKLTAGVLGVHAYKTSGSFTVSDGVSDGIIVPANVKECYSMLAGLHALSGGTTGYVHSRKSYIDGISTSVMEIRASACVTPSDYGSMMESVLTTTDVTAVNYVHLKTYMIPTLWKVIYSAGKLYDYSTGSKGAVIDYPQHGIAIGDHMVVQEHGSPVRVECIVKYATSYYAAVSSFHGTTDNLTTSDNPLKSNRIYMVSKIVNEGMSDRTGHHRDVHGTVAAVHAVYPNGFYGLYNAESLTTGRVEKAALTKKLIGSRLNHFRTTSASTGAFTVNTSKSINSITHQPNVVTVQDTDIVTTIEYIAHMATMTTLEIPPGDEVFGTGVVSGVDKGDAIMEWVTGTLHPNAITKTELAVLESPPNFRGANGRNNATALGMDHVVHTPMERDIGYGDGFKCKYSLVNGEQSQMYLLVYWELVKRQAPAVSYTTIYTDVPITLVNGGVYRVDPNIRHARFRNMYVKSKTSSSFTLSSTYFAGRYVYNGDIKSSDGGTVVFKIYDQLEYADDSKLHVGKDVDNDQGTSSVQLNYFSKRTL